MAKYAKVSTISINACDIKEKSPEIDAVDFVIAHLEKNINPVLCEKPDLIVLPEVCDRPAGYGVNERKEYYKSRGTRVLDYLCKKAKENNCYIAYPCVAEISGVMRNCCQMIDRSGNVMGVYEKNYPMIGETLDYDIMCGRDAAVFECDFGRVSAIICFDLNFDDLRFRIKALKPDMVLFMSNFHGAFLQNYFAFDTRSYLVSAIGYGNLNGGIISPVGERIAESTLYYNHVTRTLNLDYAVVHLDYNLVSLSMMKDKYGGKVTIHDPYTDMGAVLVTNECDDRTVHDILREFNIHELDEYLKRSINHRNKYTV
ncbi:MAG: carbon-nitrogen hydrolase family protein [Ruminococcaceae bacterium]|nr:carbon-nitrogen hydrolase family protein [Oscillospiraceae bacterium]